MKTLLRRFYTISIGRMWVLGLLLMPVALQSCVTYVPARQTTVVRREVVPPPWAPQYDNVEEVRYYYLPDIEVYYDVWEHEYVYLNNGSWVFTTSFPGYYRDYDINTAYVVVLDRKVHEPWRVHQNYVSHYPRYYYRSVYEDRRTGPGRGYENVRGFNENVRTPIYRNQQPVNLGNSRDNTRQSNNNSRTSRSGNDERTNSRRETNMNTPTNSNNQPSGREVNRTDNNNNNTEHRNYTRRNENQQNAESRNERNTDNRANSNNGNNNANTTSSNTNSNSSRNTERSQPAVYTGKEVGQPVRVKREVQPAQERTQAKEERSSSRKRDESSSESTNRSRR